MKPLSRWSLSRSIRTRLGRRGLIGGMFAAVRGLCAASNSQLGRSSPSTPPEMRPIRSQPTDGYQTLPFKGVGAAMSSQCRHRQLEASSAEPSRKERGLLGPLKIGFQLGPTARRDVPTSIRYVACISGGEGGFFRSSAHAIRAGMVLATNRAPRTPEIGRIGLGFIAHP